MEALADLVAKVRDDHVERHNEHATAIEQLLQGQMKIAQFTNGLATQYGQLFKALSKSPRRGGGLASVLIEFPVAEHPPPLALDPPCAGCGTSSGTSTCVMFGRVVVHPFNQREIRHERSRAARRI